jgi:WD40 repeat protein
MKRMGFHWLAAMITLVLATPALPQNLPPTEPILRIETGMHLEGVSIGIDASCRLMVTGSTDKTARVWALPESGTGEPKLKQVLRVPIGLGNDGVIYSVAMSPDGRAVAVGGSDVYEAKHQDIGVYIFDAETGKLLHRLGKLTNVIRYLTFSSDGKYLAATLGGGSGLRVWETSSWGLVGEDKDYDGRESHGAAFDATDKLYTVANGGFLRRYGPDFKLEGKSKTVGGEAPDSIAINPKGDRAAVGFYDASAVDIYGTTDLQRVFAADLTGIVKGTWYSKVAWSVDGTRLYGAGGNLTKGGGPLRIWEQEGSVKARDVTLSTNTITQLLPCRDSIAVSADDPVFGLISATGEKQIWQGSESHPEMRGKNGNNFTVSDDGGQVRFGLGTGGDKPVLFDLIAGRLMDQPSLAAGLAAPDTTTLNNTDWRNNVAKLNGKPLRTGDLSRSVAIAPGADRFVLGAGPYLRAYDRDGNELWRKLGSGTAWGVNIPRGGKLVVAAHGDGTIRWRRLSDGEEIVALFVNAKTREWVTWTPQGYYASSVNGDQMVGWQLNKGWDHASEFVTAARLKKHLYRPDIVKRAFELADSEAAVREAGLSGFKLADLASRTPPEFRIVDPGDNTRTDKSVVATKVVLSETNDPVTGFDVKVNGRQVTPRNVRDINQPTKEAETLNVQIPLGDGENQIQIVAQNAVGKTEHDLLVYLDREGLLDKKGRLFVLAIGVDKYYHLPAKCGGLGNQSCDLQYASADARLIVDTLTKKAAPLHTEMISKLLVSNGNTPPTKANIEDALAMFRGAGPEDTVILFIASHGTNEGPNYLMIPEDAEKNDAGDWRPSTVVKWSDLQQALQDSQGTRIMFVDTCHSSGAYSPRLVKDAADEQVVVFTATDRDNLAHEDPTYGGGHGAFTYALSEGINGAAAGRNGLVEVLSLANYVSDRVKELTSDAQVPNYYINVKNFTLAVR